MRRTDSGMAHSNARGETRVEDLAGTVLSLLAHPLAFAPLFSPAEQPHRPYTYDYYSLLRSISTLTFFQISEDRRVYASTIEIARVGEIWRQPPSNADD